MLEDLARMILEAQHLREESWNGHLYDKTRLQAAKEAGETSGLDTRADELVHLLIAASWNDSQSWATRCLEPPEVHEEEREMICDKCHLDRTVINAGETNMCQGCINDLAHEIALKVWLQDVDIALQEVCGLPHHDDLPDKLWVEWFELGYESREAVDLALEDEEDYVAP